MISDSFEKNGKTFTYICESEAIEEGKSKKVAFDDDFSREYAVFRIKKKLYCVSNTCPHKHENKMYKGFINGTKVTCPMHGWNFSLITGENLDRNQQRKSLDIFDVIEENGKIYLEKTEAEMPKWSQNI